MQSKQENEMMNNSLTISNNIISVSNLPIQERFKFFCPLGCRTEKRQNFKMFTTIEQFGIHLIKFHPALQFETESISKIINIGTFQVAEEKFNEGTVEEIMEIEDLVNNIEESLNINNEPFEEKEEYKNIDIIEIKDEFKNEFKAEIKNEIKEEVKDELKYIKEEIKDYKDNDDYEMYI